MKSILIICSFLVVLTTTMVTSADEEGMAPEYSAEGLKLVPNSRGFALVWVSEGIDLSRYNRLYLVEPSVAFRKNWQQDQNRGHPTLRVKTSDMDRIRSEIRQIFMEVFTEELLAGGYTFSQVRAEDVLIIKPAIVNLDVNAPDLLTTADTLTDSAGSMTLYLEMYDSVTEALLVKAVDHTRDSHSGGAQWQSQVANRAAAKRMMRPWAVALGKGIDLGGATTQPTQ